MRVLQELIPCMKCDHPAPGKYPGITKNKETKGIKKYIHTTS
jgi:hypothetical protein